MNIRVFGLFNQKRWVRGEGHQVCHQVHLVPKSFQRNEISLILKETELILDGIKDGMTEELDLKPDLKEKQD